MDVEEHADVPVAQERQTMTVHCIIEGAVLAVAGLIGWIVLKDLFGEEDDTYQGDRHEGLDEP